MKPCYYVSYSKRQLSPKVIEDFSLYMKRYLEANNYPTDIFEARYFDTVICVKWFCEAYREPDPSELNAISSLSNEEFLSRVRT